MTEQTDWIWDEEALRKFLDHEHPSVRQWAIRRFSGRDKLDADLAEKLAHLLDDPSSDVAFEAWGVLEPQVSGEHIEALRRCAAREDLGPAFLARVRGTLAALGDERAREAVARHEEPEAIAWFKWSEHAPASFADAVVGRFGEAGLPVDFDFLQAAIESASAKLAGPVLDAIDELDDDTRDQLVGIALERGGSAKATLPGVGDLSWEPDAVEEDALLALIDVPVAQEARREATEELARAADRQEWSSFAEACLEYIDMLGENGGREIDSPELEWAFALADALGERPGFGGGAEERARFAYSLLFGIETIFGIEAALEEVDDLATLLAMRERGFGDEGRRLGRLIKDRYEQATISPKALAAARLTVERWLDEPGSRDAAALLDKLWLVHTFEGLDLGRYLEALVEFTDIVEDDYLRERAIPELLIRSWSRRPASFRAHAHEWLETNKTVRRAVLFALEDQNARWASRFLVDRMDELLAGPEGQQIFEHLQELGDPETLDIVVEQWRPGETTIAGCAALLARLAGRVDDLPDELLADDAQAREAADRGRDTLLQALESGEMPWDDIDDQTLRVELRCTECRRIYNYEADRIFIDTHDAHDDKDNLLGSMMANRVITCKNCGAVDSYEFTKSNFARLMPVMMRSMMSEESMSGNPMPGRVVRGRQQLFDGTRVESPSQALAYLEEQTRRHPNSGPMWRRLGNLRQKYGQPEQAAQAWQKALDVDPTEAEAAFSLAAHFWGEQTTDGATAADYVLDGLERLPQADADEETRRALAHELVGMLRAFAPYLDESLVMLAAWSGGVFGKQAVLDMSEVDIRRVTGWPRLSELFARGAFASVRFAVGESAEHDTRLERLINDEVPMPSRLPTAGSSQTYVKDEAEDVGRNDPCPCGSGKKYKRCCLRR
ncbi:MAG: SEC-C metal-binding domain-containing protein [Persicimonas sp.]